MIVVPLQGGAIAAHNLSDGEHRWKRELAVEKPLAGDADRVFITSGEAIHALDAKTGDLLWRAPLGAPATAAPLAHGGWVVAAAAGELLAIRAEDGEVIWRQTVGAVEFRPAIDGEFLIVASVDGHLLALDIQTGTVLWKSDLGSAPTEPLAIADHVFVGTQDKRFCSVAMSSGRPDCARFVGARIVGRPAADERHIYFTALDNMLWAVDRRHGAIKWKASLGYRPASGPVVLQDCVLVPGPVEVLPAYGARTGRPAGTIAFPARLVQLPLLREGETGETFAVGVTGNLESRWTLSLYRPLTVPSVPVLPLTELPGEVVAVSPVVWPSER